MRRILTRDGIPDGDAALASAAAGPTPVRGPQARNTRRHPSVLFRGPDIPFAVPAQKEAT
jgi:hypothetical protein